MSKWVVNIYVDYEGSYDHHFDTAEEAINFAKQHPKWDDVYIREAVPEYEVHEFEKLVKSGEAT